MLIDVQLPAPDIVRILHELAPLRIHMTPSDEDRRWIELDAPDEITCDPERGLRFITCGKLRYKMGFNVEATIRSITVSIVPRIVPSRQNGQRLVFEVDIENGDLEHVPALVDDALVALVNHALTPSDTRMVWDYGKTLSKRFKLPERLEPLDTFDLTVVDGQVRIDKEGLSLRIKVAPGVTRSKAVPSDDALPRVH
jgi:hypothetical protein